MSTLILVLSFIVGVSIGSFINVIILRFDNLKTVIAGRSHCPDCQHVLAWYDLVPILSYLTLRGKCRYCHKKISIQYLLVELSTGLIFLLLFSNFGVSVAGFYYSVIMAVLMVVVVIDIRSQMVPEQFVWLALLISVLGGWYFGGHVGWTRMIYGIVIGGLPLAVLSIGSREKWMGRGDIKIGMILGALTGYPVAIFSLMLSFVVGAIVGVIYMKIARKDRKATVPFAPFLVFATLIGILWGRGLVNWYLGVYIY